MATEKDTVEPSWFELGVFKFYKFSPEVISKFTINPKASPPVRKEEKHRLGNEWVLGACSFCKYKSPWYNTKIRQTGSDIFS
jgi:hypothetical protein